LRDERMSDDTRTKPPAPSVFARPVPVCARVAPVAGIHTARTVIRAERAHPKESRKLHANANACTTRPPVGSICLTRYSHNQMDRPLPPHLH
jgi:hypothetical protein